MEGPNAETEHGDRLRLVNIRDEVYEVLRQRILNHEYPPGFRFDLSELETQLGISRTPLKEALHRLEAEGFVEIRPRRGTFVISIDPQEVAENLEVRRALELYAAKIAPDEATDGDIAELHALVEDMRRLFEANDYAAVVDEYLALDRKFHQFIVSLTRNKRLMDIHEQVDGYMQIARIQQKFSISELRDTEAEHEAIMQAFEGRDRQALMQATDEHIEAARTRILEALDQRV
jgi:DNA-binding GntR family transcriptional regulator